MSWIQSVGTPAKAVISWRSRARQMSGGQVRAVEHDRRALRHGREQLVEPIVEAEGQDAEDALVLADLEGQLATMSRYPR